MGTQILYHPLKISGNLWKGGSVPHRLPASEWGAEGCWFGGGVERSEVAPRGLHGTTIIIYPITSSSH